ncbi:MAG: RsmE family RNA methyltransferase, partial [Myxococcales bacterium]|nr:RsmE family RNA methyltransferase [Myxococcales bacterium]
MSDPRRLFAAELPREGGRVVLSEEATRHARVLRLTPGDALTLFDGDGWHAPATLSELGKRAVCEAEPAVSLPDDGSGVELLLALPRAGKLDDILRAVTELGVRAVHLVACERSVGDIPAAKLGNKLARYESVVREAARQSERNRVPAVHAPRPLLD